MNQTILSTRLMMPKPRKGFVIRNDLFNKLNEIDYKRLSVIKGAPGRGKTTLLTSYIETKALSVKWITLDEECNFIPLFWSYILKALDDQLGNGSEDFVAHIQSNSGLTKMIKILINNLNPQTTIRLVLDDFHVLHHQELLASIDYFITNMPINVHVILLTRDTPPLSLPTWEMRDELLFINEIDLLFSNQEGLSFLQDTLSLSIPQEMLQQLLNKANGWIGGLQLLASSHRGKQITLNGTLQHTENLFAYINTEIFEQLGQPTQDFLTLTAPLTYFNQEIGEAILTGIDYPTLLHRLISQNLMVQCINEDQRIYQYHSLFKDFLLALFDQLDIKIKDQVYRNASQILWQLGDQAEALRYLFLMEDYPQAMAKILELPHDTTYFYYLSKLPVIVATSNFDIAIQKFFYHFYKFDYHLCNELYLTAMQYTSKDSRYQAFIGATILFNEESQVNEEPIRLKNILVMDVHPLTKSLILTKNAVILFYKDRLQESLICIKKSIALEKSNPSTHISYFNLTLETQVCEEIGFLTQALMAQQQTQQLIQNNALLKQLQEPNFLVTIAGLYMKQMRLDEAEQSLDACKDVIMDRDDQLKNTYLYNRVEYLFLCRQIEEATKMLDKLMRIEPYQDILFVSPLLKHLINAGAMSTDMQDRFITTYENISINDHTLNSQLLYAYILTVKKESQHALTILDDILTISRKQNLFLKTVEACLAKLSILLKQPHESRNVFNLFKEAIYYAYPNEILMPFFIQSDTVMTFHQQHGECIYTVLEKPEKVFYQDMIQLCKTSDYCLLSKREQEIIRAMAEGLSNIEIAERFYISLATVKTHISNIYRKLDVKSRILAIDWARQNGILEAPAQLKVAPSMK